ncbi:phosphotransferase [Microbacteriaceae bacterium 4G12]
MNNWQNQKDDTFVDRLFLFLQRCHLRVKRIVPVKKHVFFLETETGKYMIKSYETYENVKRQLLFLRALQKTGFRNTSYVEEFPFGVPYLMFENKYWLMMGYIEHTDLFSFGNETNRRAAQSLLQQYHMCSRLLSPELRNYIPSTMWLLKWRQRTATFYQHKSFISSCIDERLVDCFLKWSTDALDALSIYDFQAFPHTFVHGDIIEHNFVKHNGELYLIDFDCVSYGPIMYDYIKYCYCTLPHMKWSYEALYQYKHIRPFLTSKPFLYALIFPGDLMREWDYFLALSDARQKRFRESLIQFTQHQYEFRLAFVQKLYGIITN